MVSVRIPGDAFPINLADTELRVTRDHFDGYSSYQSAFDPPPTLFVARFTDAGYELVDFQLETMTDPSTEFRTIRITDLVPGRYAIASPDHTCAAEAATFAEGSELAEFELTEEVELPVELGVASWLGQTVADEQISAGVDGECHPVIEEVRMARNRFSLALSEQALPWAQALRYGIEIDGDQAFGFGVGTFDGPGVVTFEHALSCPSAELGPGSHTLRFVGRVDDTTVMSSSADFEFDCGASEDTGSAAGGCSIAAGSRRDGLLLLVLMAGLSKLRRRARS